MEETKGSTNGAVGGSRKSNFCGRCGSKMQDGQKFCKNCGQPAGIVPAVNVPNAVNQFNQATAAKKSKKKLWIAITSIVLAVGILGTAGYMGILSIQKKMLQKKLMSTVWWRTNIINCKEDLEFSENEIENTIYYKHIGTQRHHTSYKVINGDTIMVNSKKIKVKFGDGFVMFSSSFTDDESSSLWYD